VKRLAVFFQSLKILLCSGLLLLALGTALNHDAHGRSLKELEPLIGPTDAVMVADPEGRVLLEKNADRPLVPASILKIFTSLVAIHHLGLDHRFETEFYVDDEGNLTIKGYGDPFLVSETVEEIALTLSAKKARLNDIVLDDSHFDRPMEIPGISSSNRPYDAPNGALCVNFNTVFFKKESGVFLSAEPQTPLLPIALDRVKSSGLSRGRILLSHDENLITLYAGRLFEHFLHQAGVVTSGNIRVAGVRPGTDRLLHCHVSPLTLQEMTAKLLDHSSNFTTNQILIAAGAKAYGSPGTLEKGVRAAQTYARKALDLQTVRFHEGSGISRQNRITAREMGKVLKAFAPYYSLLRKDGRQHYKTGTLAGISTRAGFIENPGGRPYRFVVMMNSPGKSADQVTRRLLDRLE
jgi:serine-type D-Ala-D-Ala carboxypeptidase/endopeptidase (penicillin-binding protein 4)